MNEEKNIMDMLGIGQLDGNVRGEHTGKLLTFLKMHENKDWNFVLDVAPLVLGIGLRYLKENYLRAIIRLGIIKIYSKGNNTYYKWVGEKAFNGHSLLPSEPEQVMQEIEKEKQQFQKNICPQCGKTIPENQRFCDEKCLSNYYMKKKKEKN